MATLRVKAVVHFDFELSGLARRSVDDVYLVVIAVPSCQPGKEIRS